MSDLGSQQVADATEATVPDDELKETLTATPKGTHQQAEAAVDVNSASKDKTKAADGGNGGRTKGHAPPQFHTPIRKARKAGTEVTVTCEVIGALKKLLAPKKGRPPKVTTLQVRVSPHCTRPELMQAIGDKLQLDPLILRINYKKSEVCNVTITKGILSYLVEPPDDGQDQ